MRDGDLDTEFEDEDRLAVASVVGQGGRFTYVFDFGDDWTHECVVEQHNFDPIDR